VHKVVISACDTAPAGAGCVSLSPECTRRRGLPTETGISREIVLAQQAGGCLLSVLQSKNLAGLIFLSGETMYPIYKALSKRRAGFFKSDRDAPADKV